MRLTTLPFMLVLLLTSATLADDKALSLYIKEGITPETLTCKDEIAKTLVLKTSEKSFHVRIGNLIDTGLVNSYSVCHILLSRWFKTMQPQSIFHVELEPITHRSDQRSLPQYRMLAPDLEGFCLNEGLCASHLLHHSGIDKTLRNCRPQFSFSARLAKLRPSLLAPRIEPIKNVEIEAFPFNPLSQELFSALDSDTSSMVSTMTIGNRTAIDLRRNLKETRNHVLLALDAGTILLGQQSRFLWRIFSDIDNLSIFPITSGHEFQSIFHWKLLLSADSKKSILTSMNLSTPASPPLVDFSYFFSDEKVADELRGRLLHTLFLQCQRIEELECLSRFSASTGDSETYLDKMLQSSCKHLEDVWQKPELPPSRYFMESSDTDLLFFVRNLIQEAQDEIVIFTHKFTLADIIPDLHKANQRGVKVFIFSGTPAGMPDDLIPHFFHDISSLQFQMPLPHMKSMLVDRKTLFFGTGNFSQNAFRFARELFAVTSSKTAIDTVLRFSQSYHRAFFKDTGYVFEESDAEKTWVYLNKRSEATLSTTEPDERNWMSAYRIVKSEHSALLKRCSLSNSKIITEEDFLLCLQKN